MARPPDNERPARTRIHLRSEHPEMRAPGFTATELATLALAVLAAAWGVGLAVLDRSAAIFHAATAPAFIIAFLTVVHMWARVRGEMGSTRYLALFSLVLSAFIAMSGFLLREPPLYAWGELVIGGLLVLATGYDAWISYPSRQGDRPLDPRTNV